MRRGHRAGHRLIWLVVLPVVAVIFVLSQTERRPVPIEAEDALVTQRSD